MHALSVAAKPLVLTSYVYSPHLCAVDSSDFISHSPLVPLPVRSNEWECSAKQKVMEQRVRGVGGYRNSFGHRAANLPLRLHSHALADDK